MRPVASYLEVDHAYAIAGHVQHVKLPVFKASADGPSSLSGGFGIKLSTWCRSNQKRAQRPRVRLIRKVGPSVSRWPSPHSQAAVPIRGLAIWSETSR